MGGKNSFRLSVFAASELEKYLWSQDAVDTLIDDPVTKGVQKFRTPSGYTLSRTL